MLYHRYANAMRTRRPAEPQVDNSIPALVAQRIEHLTTDQKVGGSSPSERASSQAPRHAVRGFSTGPGATLGATAPRPDTEQHSAHRLRGGPLVPLEV
jgi:hypothetical protein